jgi:hypothetical protein
VKLYVRFGSLADIEWYSSHVRFNPKAEITVVATPSTGRVHPPDKIPKA